jgi:protein O-mannosyl-transferase
MPQNRNLEHPCFVSALLVLAALAVYLPVIGLNFLTFDDDGYVTRNPQVVGGLTWAGLRWAFTQAHCANWHPLTWLSHMLDCQLYGLNPAGHHLTNLLFHATNAVLLFLWLRSLTAAFWRSAFVAALFALHPLHVESVAWVAERKDVLCSFFGLLSLWAYTKYARVARGDEPELGTKCEVRNPRTERSLKSETRNQPLAGSTRADRRAATPVTRHAALYYSLALLLFGLGLMSKPMLVTWPCVMLLLDYWPLGRMEKAEWRRQNAECRTPQPATRTTHHAPRFTFHVSLLLEKLPFFGLAAASSVITVLAQKAGGALVPLTVLPLGARILNALDGYLRYCWHLFWPTDLAVIYTFTGRTAAETALAGLLVIGVTIVAIWQRKRQPYLLVGWAWFLGTLVPVIGLAQVGYQTMADRYTYLPAIGLFIVLAWGAAELAATWPRRRLALASAAAASLTACALTAQAQLLYWQNSESLFRHALIVTKDNYVAWSGLGYYLAEQGQPRQAEACYRAAVEINPSFAEAWNGLGYTLAAMRRHDEAITSFETAIRLVPDHLKARDNLATTLAACGRLDEAKAQCRAASQLDAHAAEPHSNLGALLAREGKWVEAVAEFRLALERDPLLDEARCGLAGALAKQGNYEEAIRALTELLKLRPANSPARLQLGVILALQGNGDQAISEFSELLRANPADSAAHYHLALALSAQGKFRDAILHYRAAVKARPDFPEALNNLAWMLATQPDPQLRDGQQALDLAERACRLTEYKRAFMVGTLAAAYAEAGRFPEAVAAAEKAKALAEKANDKEVAATNLKLLVLYRSGRPYRDTP